MKVSLNIHKNGVNDWLFNVTFYNDTNSAVRLPIDAIQRSGDRIGFKFLLNGDGNEPVDFTIVSPSEEPKEVEISANKKCEVSFVGHLDKKAPGVAALSFAHAVYRIELGKEYQVGFVWHDMKSDVVDWTAD
jgi:hypothetical protein